MIMKTNTEANYDCSAPVPLLAAPHFDSASIEQAKSVEPLSQPLSERSGNRHYNHRRFLTVAAILIGVMFVVLEVATVIHLNRQLDVSSSFDEVSRPVAAETETADESNKEDSSAGAIDKPPVVTVMRSRRAARRTQALPTFDAGQRPSSSRSKARLVAVIK
jgi:hypothetical protein